MYLLLTHQYVIMLHYIIQIVYLYNRCYCCHKSCISFDNIETVVCRGARKKKRQETLAILNRQMSSFSVAYLDLCFGEGFQDFGGSFTEIWLEIRSKISHFLGFRREFELSNPSTRYATVRF